MQSQSLLMSVDNKLVLKRLLCSILYVLGYVILCSGCNYGISNSPVRYEIVIFFFLFVCKILSKLQHC